MGRIAPDLAVQDAVVPRSALPDIMDRIAEIRDRHGLSISNVFHAGDGNLHPNISFDRRDPDLAAPGPRGLHARSWRPASQAGGSITGEHGVGSDKLDYMPWIFDAETLGAMRAVRRVFDPTERANPGQGRALPRLPRMARGTGGPMSDVVHGRLRALLGTSGVERDAGGPPARHSRVPRTRCRWSAGWPTRRAGRSGSRARAPGSRPTRRPTSR